MANVCRLRTPCHDGHDYVLECLEARLQWVHLAWVSFVSLQKSRGVVFWERPPGDTEGGKVGFSPGLGAALLSCGSPASEHLLRSDHLGLCGLMNSRTSGASGAFCSHLNKT